MSLMGIPLMARFTRSGHATQIDTQWQGDNVSASKANNTTRFMFHNTNGMSLYGPDGLAMFVNEQNTLEVDVQGITEHCLDSTKFPVYQTAQDIIRTHYNGQTLLHLNSSQEQAINLYKPGGTGLLLLGDVVSQLEPQGCGGDSMGRWTFIHLRRRNQAPLTIISAYQVCPRPTNLLGNTAYHQQTRALSEAGDPDLHPRKAFIRDLEAFLSELIAKGHDILMGGDFNEALEDKNSGILKLITSTNLTDPFLYRFPQHNPFGTHIMGSRRIDYTFVTPNLLPALKKIGYAPFQYTKPSDHRPIFLEFDTKVLFGHRSMTVQTAVNRTVKSNDKATVTKFITTWYHEIARHNGFSLQSQLDNDCDESQHVVETLDEIIGTSGHHAEQACRKRRPEFYSQKLVQQRLRVSILRGHLHSMRLGVDRSAQLQRRMGRGGIDFPLPTTLRATIQALREASVSLQQTCKEHADIRQTELYERIEEAALKGNKTKAKILRSIKKVEATKQTYKILQKMKRRSVTSHQLDRIEIPASWPEPHGNTHFTPELEDPKTCTDWKLITEPSDIEYYLMLRNRLHFGQAEGTPFTCTPLSDDLDWAASTDPAEQMLQGSYTCTTTIPNCEDLLQECKYATKHNSIPAEVTMDEFKGKIKSWRETTATSPSGRHLGRYKSLFTSGILDDESDNPDDTTFAEKQESIAKLLLSVINYCIRHCYVLSRWKKIINIMIFKEHGNYKIHRLRIIHIYEADFNLLMAVKWRQLLRQADEQDLINEGQYGGRPGCEAQSLTLLEELKYDLSYLTRRTLFNFDNDATSCYDRIVVPFASVINRKYGLHQKVVALHANTLQQAQYHIKTANGISDTSYTSCARYPIHGTGQGSGNSPSIWLFISSTLFDVHSKHSHGATFISPDGTHSATFSMVGFVDDSTGTCNDFQPQKEDALPALLHHMEKDAQLWNNLLFCSGGKLELCKCSFHVLRFDFQPDGRPLPTIDVFDNKIHVTDIETGSTIPIQSKRAFDPHKTLGHYKAPTSTQKLEMKNLQSKADRIALLISTSPLTRQGAFLAYQTVYLPSIRYTLPQSFFSRRELEKAQSSSLQKIIPKCGYNRHTAHAILFAPLHYAGGGFVPWHLLQGEGQVMQFIKHWRTNTVLSKTLRVALAWAQWQSGHHIPIMEDTTTPIPYLECRWLKSLREFLGEIDARIIVNNPFLASPERQNDIYIMQYARDCGQFKPKDLAIINYCRLYLHVTTVSELFDANGKYILPFIFKCQRDPWFNPSTYVTLQKRPSEYQVRTKWQLLCRQWATASGQLGASFNLGKWTVPGHQLRRWRQAYLVPTKDNTVYCWHQTSYWEFQRISPRTSTYRPIQATSWTPTTMCVPVDVIMTAENNLMLQPRQYKTSQLLRSPAQSSTFAQYLQHVSTWEQFFLQGISFKQLPYEILHYITMLTDKTSLLLVSDGSQKQQLISYGWVFGTDMSQILAEHSGQGSGAATSHRAEACGMLSAALFLYHLYTYTSSHHSHQLQNIPLILMSDNNGLVQRITQRRQYTRSYPNATLAPDWDIIEQLHETLQKLPHKDISIRWVKGHQDDQENDLPVDAQYNVRADALAETVYESGLTTPDIQIMLPAAQCHFYVKHTMIQGHYSSAIRDAYLLPSYYRYLSQRHGWTQNIVELVDWQVFQRATTNLTFNRVQLTKLVHHKLPTNCERSKSNPHQTPKCHYCDQQETFLHLLQCHNEHAREFRTRIHDKIETYMEDQCFPPRFKTVFLQFLSEQVQPHQPPMPAPNDSRTKHCLQEQGFMGTSAFLQGFLTRSWRQLYMFETTLYGHDPENDVITILAGILKILWKEQLRLWETHLKTVTTPTTSIAFLSHRDKIHTYKTRIRHLHSKKDQCLPAHQTQYFQTDLEHYLNTATATQMRLYLHHYEPAVQTSIRAAAHRPLRTLLTFPGYVRKTLVEATPHIRTLRNLPKDKPSDTQCTVQREPTIHHKHTRWREIRKATKSIRQYFAPSPD